MYTIVYPYTHLFLYSYIHIFVYSYIYISKHSYIHIFIYSYLHIFAAATTAASSTSNVFPGCWLQQPSWGPLGDILGPSWGHLGAILGLSEGHLGPYPQTGRFWPQDGPKRTPRWAQEGPQMIFSNMQFYEGGSPVFGPDSRFKYVYTYICIYVYMYMRGSFQCNMTAALKQLKHQNIAFRHDETLCFDFSAVLKQLPYDIEKNPSCTYYVYTYIRIYLFEARVGAKNWAPAFVKLHF